MKKDEGEEDEKRIIEGYLNHLANEEMSNLFYKTEFKDNEEQKRAIDALMEVLHHNPESVPMLKFILKEGYKDTPPIWTAEVIYKTADSIDDAIKEAMQSLRPKKIEELKRGLNIIEMVLSIKSNKPVISNAVESVRDKLVWYKAYIEDILKEEGLPQIENKEVEKRRDHQVISQEARRIVIKPEAVNLVFHLLKDHFPKEQQEELKRILIEGDDTNHPLYFMDNGTRLAHALRYLKESDIITGCNKKQLEEWLITNFVYKNKKGKIAHFSADYATKLISRNSNICKNPITGLKEISENN